MAKGRDRFAGRGSALAAALLTSVAFSGPAWASSAQDPQPSVAQPEEIIITARRRDEALGRASVPVSVADGEELIERGVRQASDLDSVFPALTVQPTATGNLIFIRGVGNFTLLPNSDPAVGYSYDGVFIGRPMGTMSQFFDLDRIELLKGPQGVLYGRNASAGSINIEPRHPVLGETSGHFIGSVATYDQMAEAAANLPLADKAAMRLSLALGGEAPYLAGYRSGRKQRSGRAQLKAAVTDRVSVRLSTDYNRLGGTGIGSSYVGNYVYDRAAGLYRFTESGLPLSEGIYSAAGQAFRETIFLPSVGRYLDAIGSTPGQDLEFYGAHARIDAALGFADLTVIPAWRRASLDSIVPSSPFGYGLREKNEQTSLEARLAGRQGPVEWLAGGFLFDELIDNETMSNLSSLFAQLSQSYDTASRALFANATIHASRSLRISGGLRWTRDAKSFESDGTNLAIICTRFVNGLRSCPTAPLFPLVDDLAELPFAVPQLPGTSVPLTVGGVPTGAIVNRTASSSDGDLVDRAITWRVGAEADVVEKSLLYASVETGYRPGGFNAGVGFETYDPERLTAYTLGFRHRALGDRLQIDLEAFWWKYRDQQVSSLRPDLSTPPRNVNITDNIADSRIRGVELDVRFRPWRGAQAGAVIQRLDSDYGSFEYPWANTGVPPLTGCDAVLDTATNLYTVNCSDKQPYNSPKWAIGLHGRQTFELSGMTLTAVIDTHFRSARNIGFAFLPEQRIGSTWTSNAQLIFTPRRGPLELALFVRNIEGNRTPLFMIYHPASNALIALTSPPRQWGLRAQWKF